MEPSELEALSKLPDKQIMLLTYEKVHDMHLDIKENVKPRIVKLEHWKTKMSGAMAAVGALLTLGLIKIKGGHHDF